MASVLQADPSNGRNEDFDSAGSFQLIPERRSSGCFLAGRRAAEQASSDRPETLRPTHDRAAAEWCNSLAYGVGTVLSVVGAGALLGRLRASADWTLILGCAVYSSTLLTVYVFSILSHHLEGRWWKRTFRRLDQAFIYLLIVGTYTPVAAMCMSGGRLSTFYWALWCVALVGFLAKTIRQHRIDARATAGFVVLGWVPLLAARSVWLFVPKPVLVLLVVGVVCYMIGLVFFVRNAKERSSQVAWHLLVIAGSAAHFYAVILSVTAAPAAASA